MIVLKSTLNKLREQHKEQIKTLKEQGEALATEYKERALSITERNDELTKECENLKAEVEKLKTQVYDMNSSYMRISFSDDLSTFQPHFHIKDEAIEAMTLSGYISDADMTNKHAVQVGMMIATYNAMGDLLDQFAHRGDSE